MEKGRICKICNKRFANGKAMGGHMRSHLAMAKLPFPPKKRLPPLPPSPPQQLSNSSELSPFSSPPRNTRFSNTNAATMHMKSSLPRLLNPEPSLDSSETESCAKNPTRRRSKRRRKTMMVKAVVEPPPPQPFEAEQQVSSVSDSDDISSTEDGAMCLIMLSRDTWDRPKQVKKEVVDSFEAEAEAKEEEEKEEEGEEDSPSRARVLTPARTEAKFKCETCNKLFHSYQALGGHRASHKRMKNPEVLDEDEDFKVEEEEGDDDAANGNGNGNGNANGNDNDNGNLVVEHETKTIECPFCFKLFDSAQALGRHTKVHYRTDVGNARLSSSYANFKDNLVIDLNLPAPEAEEEEEDEEEVSQVEFPTVSE